MKNSRQYRTILMVQMRGQIFRQSKQKFARIVDPLRRIFVTNDGKDASRCAIKVPTANCAVLPYTSSAAKEVSASPVRR